MRQLRHFSRTAMAGFAASITIIALAMVVGIRSMGDTVRAHESQLRASESRILVGEKLRWRARSVVAAAKNYLDSSDPALLPAWHQAGSEFDTAVPDFLREARSDPPNDAAAVVGGVERAALDFARIHAALIKEVERTGHRATASRRFYDELLPVHRSLGGELDRFVQQAHAAFLTSASGAERSRSGLLAWMYTTLGIVVVAAFAIAWYSTRQLSRAFRVQEEALEAARHATSARDELMAIVAHDLRNPLAAITMKASLLREAAGSERTRAQAASIENVTTRMDFLIKSMLDVVMIEEGQFSIHPATSDAAEIVGEISDMFGTVAQAKQIDLVSKVTPLRIGILADKDRVIEAMTNLVANALKFTPPGGRVTITADVERDHARFAVSDTGPGIASEDIPRVFDRFWTKGAAGQKGTGLGLFITKCIVVAHGGEIWIESEVGRGATFYFSLPLAPQETRGVPAPPRETPATA